MSFRSVSINHPNIKDKTFPWGKILEYKEVPELGTVVVYDCERDQCILYHPYDIEGKDSCRSFHTYHAAVIYMIACQTIGPNSLSDHMTDACMRLLAKR